MRLAWLLRALLALLLALALAWLVVFIALGWWVLAVAGALALLMPHAPFMVLEFVTLHRAGPSPGVPRATMAEMVRACTAEVVGAVRVFGWQMPFRPARFADRLGADAMGRRGVLLVHGFVCNRGLWNDWRPRLRDVPCIALDLQPLFGSIDSYVPLIDDAVQRLQQATGKAPLLVGHSMGGLALRAWLRAHDADIRMHGAVTIGTPHHGTWMARFGWMRNTQQMRHHSRWLAELAAAEPVERYRRFTCFYSHCDNVVLPCDTATLVGADNRHLRGHAHVQLLRHPAVFDEVLRRLD